MASLAAACRATAARVTSSRAIAARGMFLLRRPSFFSFLPAVAMATMILDDGGPLY
jgi:hypothetical protein